MSQQKIISDEKDAIDTKRARNDVKWMSTRPYLDQTVVPILLQGLIALSKERYVHFLVKDLLSTMT